MDEIEKAAREYADAKWARTSGAAPDNREAAWHNAHDSFLAGYRACASRPLTEAEVEALARELIIHKFGIEALLAFDPPPEATKLERKRLLDRCEEARADVRIMFAALSRIRTRTSEANDG